MVQSDTDVAKTYDKVSSEYDASFADKASEGQRAFFDLYDSLTWHYISEYLPADKAAPILDAGGGTGKWTLRMAEQGHTDLRLLDISAGMLEKAQKRVAEAGLDEEISLHEGDIRRLPWADNTFALALSEADAVGYCLDEWKQAVAELVRVCAPGGTVIVSADDLLAAYLGHLLDEGEEHAARVRETRLSVDPYGMPIRCFSPREMSDALQSAGAEVIKVITKPALLMYLYNQPGSKLMQQPGFFDQLKQLDIWACEEGYITGGSHIHVVARKTD